MRKVIMKKVPKSLDFSKQYEIMKSWSAIIVEKYKPNNEIEMISVKEVTNIIINEIEKSFKK